MRHCLQQALSADASPLSKIPPTGLSFDFDWIIFPLSFSFVLDFSALSGSLASLFSSTLAFLEVFSGFLLAVFLASSISLLALIISSGGLFSAGGLVSA